MLNLDTHLKEVIDLGHSLFLCRGNSQPEDSAKYYVIYTILGCGSTFTALHNKLKKVFNLRGLQGRRDLENGRENLIEEGLLAKILFHHKIHMEKWEEARIFRGEQYLPVNPRAIYEDICHTQENRYELLDSYHELLELLCEMWKNNFRGHGLLIKRGILSVYCTSPWLLFSLLNYLSIWKEKEKSLYIMTSSTRWCRPPLFSPLVSTLDKGLKLRALMGISRETEELRLLKRMKQAEIRHLSKEEIITNRLSLAGHEYVADLHKILGTESKYSGYVATIYLNMKDIAEQFRTSFEARWERASPF